MSKKSARVDDAFTIGRLSSLAQVDVATVRFYERSGLLEAQERTRSGYRLYSRNSLARLQFIRRAREIGYSLDEVKKILELYDKGGRREDVQRFAACMIAEVDEKIRGLSKWRQLFTEIADYADHNEGSIEPATVDYLMRMHCKKTTH